MLGRQLIDRLNQLDPREDIDTTIVNDVLNDLSEINEEMLKRAIEQLEEHKKYKFAQGLKGQYKREDNLLNCYFGNRCFSSTLDTTKPDILDGCRASVLFYLSLELQNILIEEVRKIPNAGVSVARNFQYSKEIIPLVRFIELSYVTRAMNAVQFDVEQFFSWIEPFLNGKSVSGGRSTSWPYDAESLYEAVLLGFKRSGNPRIINSGILHSQVVAAGALRSHLEAVLFQIDFKSSMKSRKAVDYAKLWSDIIKEYKKSGKISDTEYHWAVKTYEWLSLCIHQGLLFSYGEVWTLGKVVKRIQESLKN